MAQTQKPLRTGIDPLQLADHQRDPVDRATKSKALGHDHTSEHEVIIAGATTERAPSVSPRCAPSGFTPVTSSAC